MQDRFTPKGKGKQDNCRNLTGWQLVGRGAWAGLKVPYLIIISGL